MSSGLIMPTAMLVLVLFAAMVVLRLDTRSQRMQQRIAAIGPRAAAGALESRPGSIRVARRRNLPLRNLLQRFLHLPIDTPAAHVMPIGAVTGGGLIVGVASAWVAQLFVGALPALGIGIAVGIQVVRTIFGWERRRYGDLLRRQMPDMIELLASSVRAGLPVAEAFRTVARELPSPTREEFGRIIREIALGMPTETALMAMHQRSGVSEYAIFAVTLGVQSRSGGRLTETVQMLAETIRQRIALAARAGALSAEAKLSATVLTVLPFIGGGLMAMTQQDYFGPLIHDPRGRHMVMIGFALLGTGQIIMRKMIASATRG